MVSESMELRCGALVARIRVAEPGVELQQLGEAGPALRLTIDAPGWRGPSLVSRGRVKTRAGPVQRIELQTPGSGGVGTRLWLGLAEDGSCALLDLSLENRGAEPLSLGVLRPLIARDPTLRATPCDLLGTPAEQGAWLRVGDANPWLAGFVRPGRVSGGWPGEAPRAAQEDHSGGTLAPGEVLTTGRIWLATGRSHWRLQEDWASWAGAEREATLPHRGVFLQSDVSSDSSGPDVQSSDSSGPDVRSRETHAQRGLEAVGALHRVADPLAAAHLAGRLFGLEIDLTADDRGLDTWRSRAALAALCSAVLTSQQPLAELAPEQRDLLQRCIPPLARAPERLGEALVVISLAGGRKLVWLGNRAREARDIGVALATLGCRAPQHVFDFFAACPLGLIVQEVPPQRVAAGDCLLLALTPEAPRPQVIGTTLHVGMGALEVAALRQEEAGLRLLLRHPGHHTGDVWIAHPDGTLQRVPVDFEDQLEVPVPSGG